jgi:demethoxyubiquinone hydroxylase (CLK1/Coq7/Cat5 family)
MIRVDQAGEYGATRIYAGQMAVMRRNCPEAKLIARMAAQEERHLRRFNALMAERRVRPTALQPLWKSWNSRPKSWSIATLRGKRARRTRSATRS